MSVRFFLSQESKGAGALSQSQVIVSHLCDNSVCFVSLAGSMRSLVPSSCSLPITWLDFEDPGALCTRLAEASPSSDPKLE